ncbi:MAG: hypothetical protein CL760_05240 [Chloroflexi bacterium]|nr:hypothetical protein [Chloroflexota bacterium]|tara:strand:+ start:18228 stop:18473 length:246 start_codon:yes stop_codon:yes gene_type:complete
MFYYRIGSILVLVECINKEKEVWLMTIMFVPEMTEEMFESGADEPDWIVVAKSEVERSKVSLSQQLNALKETARKEIEKLK